MNPKIHRVHRTTFDLQIAALADARPLQERVGVFSRQRLPAVLERVLARFAAEDFSFERLELDLGVLEFSNLEQSLSSGIRRALEAFMLRHLPIRSVAAMDLGSPREITGGAPLLDNEFDASQRLRRFLRGDPLSNKDDANRLLRNCLSACAGPALALIRDLGRVQATRKRLAHLDAVVDLVHSLEPQQADWIVDYVAEIERAHQQQALVNENSREFRAVMWEFVLSYLLLERGSYFNTKSMVGYTLLRMASRYGVSYEYLLSRLVVCVQAVGQTPPHSKMLPAILLELQREQAPSVFAGKQAGVGRVETPMHMTRRRLEDFSWYLIFGVLPPACEVDGGAPTLLALLLEQDPDHLRLALRQLGQKHTVRHRLAHQFSEHQLRQVIACLEPRDAPWIVASVKTMQSHGTVVQEQLPRFTRQLWEFVLCALLVERGSYFNQRAYVKSLLQQMARRYRIAYHELLRALVSHPIADVSSAPSRTTLSGILLSLYGESVGTAAKSLPPINALPALISPSSPRDERNDALPAHAAGKIGRALQALFDSGMVLARGSQFNRLSYLKAELSRLAESHGLSYAAILGGGVQTAASASAEIRDLLAILRQDEQVVSEPIAQERDPEVYFLLHGALPPGIGLNTELGMRWLEQGLSAGGQGQWQTRLPALIRDHRPRWLALLVERLLHYSNAAQLNAVVAAVTPHYAGFVSTYLTLLEALEIPSGEPAASRARRHWRVLLRFLLDPRHAAFSLTQLLEQTSDALARQLHVTPAAYRQAMLSHAQTQVLAAPRYGPLIDFLEKADRHHQGDIPWVMGRTDSAGDSAPQAHALPKTEAEQAAHLLREILRRGPTVALAADNIRAGAFAGMSRDAILERIAQAMAKHPALFRTWLTRAASRSLERHRLATLASDTVRDQASRVLFGDVAYEQLRWWQRTLAHVLADLKGDRSETGIAHWQATMAGSCIALYAGRNPASGIETILLALLRNMATEHRMAGAHLLERVRDEFRKRLPAPTVDAYSVLERITKTWKQPLPERLTPPEKRNNQRRIEKTDSETELADTFPEDMAFRVANAGQVILWPFLDRYFRELGMLGGGDFSDFTQRSRAVYLLHYLCTGTIDVDEHDLLLARILCGFEDGQAPERGGPLSEQESELSAQLLAAVTQHWEKLKNTSAEGLQETFLQRPGRLRRRDDNWLVTIEPMAFDVLLASLPWALSNIRLSWMKVLLKAEWK